MISGLPGTARSVVHSVAMRSGPPSTWTKLFGESVGFVYAKKHGLEVINIRIGSLQPAPADTRQLQTWLSYPDAISIFEGALEADVRGVVTVYGGSANTGRWWSDEGYDELGFSPIDDAAKFGETVPAEKHPSDWQGGVFGLPWYTGSGPLAIPFRQPESRPGEER